MSLSRRTPMKRGNARLRSRSKLAAKTELRRTGSLKRGGPPRRVTPLRQVSEKRARQIRERRAMLLAKYPGIILCEVPYCNRVADDAHEPLTRARGGSITDPDNVKAVCRPHHDEITFEEPEWAYLGDFLKHSWPEERAS